MGEEKTYLIQIKADDKLDKVKINLRDICVDEVRVESWGHSGPVSATLLGVPVIWLLDKLLELKETS